MVNGEKLTMENLENTFPPWRAFENLMVNGEKLTMENLENAFPPWRAVGFPRPHPMPAFNPMVSVLSCLQNLIKKDFK